MLKDFGDVLRECYRRGWITTRDGNISLRYKDGDILYITPSGVKKTEIYEKDIIKMYVVDNKVILNTQNPSGELELHSLLQSKFKEESRAVLHSHATHIVAAMELCNLKDLYKQFPELSRYTKVGSNVSYHAPLTKELAKATTKKLGLNSEGDVKYDIVGLQKHGVISVGKTIWEAFEHLERLDHVCQIWLLSVK